MKRHRTTGGRRWPRIPWQDARRRGPDDAPSLGDWASGSISLFTGCRVRGPHSVGRVSAKGRDVACPIADDARGPFVRERAALHALKAVSRFRHRKLSIRRLIQEFSPSAPSSSTMRILRSDCYTNRLSCRDALRSFPKYRVRVAHRVMTAAQCPSSTREPFKPPTNRSGAS